MELCEQLVKQISSILAACISIVSYNFLRPQFNECLDTLLTLLDNFNVAFDLLCYFSSLNGNLFIEKVFKVLLVHWKRLRCNELRDLKIESRACLFKSSFSALLADVSPR